ncbi:MAE_28990/MAE_18760 family HEPN-like nuclease [Amycolatopsis sp. WAC 04197]|uniref:MAE_28990/MAE_18760 family HEPN-like nuclease n=1 Tax=Amycolatopsis sp. WAC 04197 TaxID=2203199 RepID=UPI0013157619
MATDIMAPVLRLHNSARELADFISLVEHLETLRRTTRPPSTSENAGMNALNSLVPVLAGTAWKRQYYSFIIVQLYSMHERFIRDLVESFARVLGQVFSSYDKLPDRVRKHHLLLTLQHLQELSQNSSGDTTLLQDDVRRLGDCLDGIIQLNESAMSRHTANFRYETIRNILLRLDFEVGPTESDEYFKTFPYGALDGLYTTPESVIDELADRRNEVAHGSDFEILDIETLKDIADTVYRFDVWIFRNLSNFQICDLVSREGLSVGSVTHVWKDKETGERSIGQFLQVAAEVSAGAKAYLVGEAIKMCSVKEIQANQVKIKTATPDGGPFGINFDISIREKYELRLLAAKWSEVESALRDASDEQVKFSFSQG